jgi:hypothetical protein
MKTMVCEVNTATEWSEFWDLPKGVYTGDPYYQSPGKAMIEASLFRSISKVVKPCGWPATVDAVWAGLWRDCRRH